MRRTGTLGFALALLLSAGPAWTDGFGGGWAVPSLDTSIAITTQAGIDSVIEDIIASEGRAARAGAATATAVPDDYGGAADRERVERIERDLIART